MFESYGMLYGIFVIFVKTKKTKITYNQSGKLYNNIIRRHKLTYFAVKHKLHVHTYVVVCLWYAYIQKCIEFMQIFC